MNKTKQYNVSTCRRLGALMVWVGAGYYIGFLFQIKWLPFIVLGVLFVIESGFAFFQKDALGLVENVMGLCIDIGCFFILSSVTSVPIFIRIGGAIASIGFGFILISYFYYFSSKKAGWWAFFIGWSLLFYSYSFVRGDLTTLNLILCICLGSGSGLLIWGLRKRLLGLVIAGCLTISTGFGVYSAWNQVVSPNGLTETGIMLVWFGLGWGSITIFSRIRMTKYIGWPLIPAGILGVVGWGLYSGGDPNNAMSFIGNTGSLAVLIFGLYFLLMRRGIRG